MNESGSPTEIKDGFLLELNLLYQRRSGEKVHLSKYPQARSMEILRKAFHENGGDFDKAIAAIIKALSFEHIQR